MLRFRRRGEFEEVFELEWEERDLRTFLLAGCMEHQQSDGKFSEVSSIDLHVVGFLFLLSVSRWETE